MARIVIYDEQGNVRMDRNTQATILRPHPSFAETEWSSLLVKSCLEGLKTEEDNLAKSRG